MQKLEEVRDCIARVLFIAGPTPVAAMERTARRHRCFSNPLAALVIVHFGETVLRLLPRGTHDPAKFVRPSELRSKLDARGFHVGPSSG